MIPGKRGPQGRSDLEKESAPPAREELEEFLEIRGHVKRIQGGTPLLFRTSDAAGREELRICTFAVTQDLQNIRWEAHEDGGETKGVVAINTILAIDVEKDEAPEDGHFALTLTTKGSNAKKPRQQMTLICASPEDLESWAKGLRFLMESDTGASVSTPSVQSPSSAAAGQSRGGPGSPSVENDLRHKLMQQDETIASLKRENDLLQESIRRKDATITELIRETQNGPTERCNKTESTSRESDDHLRDREIAILQRKNKKLTKALRAKQQTVNDLVQMIGRLNEQHGGESSAVEDVNVGSCSDGDTQQLLTASPARASNGTVGASQQIVVNRISNDGSPSGGVEDDSEEGRGDDEEILALTSKVVELEKAFEGLKNFSPPPRDAAISAAPQTSPKAPGQGAPPSQPSLLPNGTSPAAIPKTSRTDELVPNARAAGAIAAARGVPASIHPSGLSASSRAALEALAKETEALEQKKRLVEHLARTLEPASFGDGDDDDDEDDDGFPLR